MRASAPAQHGGRMKRRSCALLRRIVAALRRRRRQRGQRLRLLPALPRRQRQRQLRHSRAEDLGHGAVVSRAPARELRGRRARHAGRRRARSRDAPGGRCGCKQEGALDAAVQFIAHARIEAARADRHRRRRARQEAVRRPARPAMARSGEGNAALQAPALAARSDWYLVTQLVNYKEGTARRRRARYLRRADARHRRDAAGRQGHHRRRRLHQHAV